ncbi:spidroin-2-like [Scomber scombrus]|uniref:Spidroin-2-like n=2 Tax=Scomber scombrus TaxID=13677 RepID=A0AAV1QIT9_SCOSC
MVLGLSLRVSWICLLLFSSGACFPAAGDYKYPGYPYMAPVAYDGSSAPGSTSIPIVPYGGGSAPGSSSIPIVPYGGGSAPGSSSIPIVPYGGGSAPGSSSIPIVPYGGGSAPGSSSIPIVPYGGGSAPGSSSIPIVPYSGAGYVSPPVGTGKKTPSFPVQHQPAAGSSPMYGSSGFAYPAGNAGYPSRDTAAGDHDILFPYGSSSMYGASSGFAYPARNAGQPSRNTAAGYNALPYRSPVGGSSQPEGAMASPGFATAGAASDLNAWLEARPFIDLSFLESAQGMQLSGSQKTSPPMPSSYIVQSRNGYVRDREAFSHKTYSPEFPEPPVMRSKSISAPGIYSKGGKKV